jgi:hypothetical protein
LFGSCIKAISKRYKGHISKLITQANEKRRLWSLFRDLDRRGKDLSIRFNGREEVTTYVTVS